MGMSLGLRLGLASTRTTGGGYLPEATALFARMTVQPDNPRKKLINTLINSLKDGGVWDKLDCFYMLAAHHEQAARRNWKADAFNLTGINSPAFLLDRGFTGNGTSSYLDSGFVPGGGSDKFLLNSGHIGVGVGTNVAEDRNDIGNANDRIFARTSGGNISGRSRHNVAPTGALPTVTTSVGRATLTRVDANVVRFHRNGIAQPDNASIVTGFSADAFRLCAANALSTKQIQLGHWGGYLTNTEVSALDAAISTYLAAVGAPV